MKLCEHQNKENILYYARLGNSPRVLGSCFIHFTNEGHVFKILNLKFYFLKKIGNSLPVQKFKGTKG